MQLTPNGVPVKADPKDHPEAQSFMHGNYSFNAQVAPLINFKKHIINQDTFDPIMNGWTFSSNWTARTNVRTALNS